MHNEFNVMKPNASPQEVFWQRLETLYSLSHLVNDSTLRRAMTKTLDDIVELLAESQADLDEEEDF